MRKSRCRVITQLCVKYICQKHFSETIIHEGRFPVPPGEHEPLSQMTKKFPNDVCFILKTTQIYFVSSSLARFALGNRKLVGLFPPLSDGTRYLSPASSHTSSLTGVATVRSRQEICGLLCQGAHRAQALLLYRREFFQANKCIDLPQFYMYSLRLSKDHACFLVPQEARRIRFTAVIRFDLQGESASWPRMSGTNTPKSLFFWPRVKFQNDLLALCRELISENPSKSFPGKDFRKPKTHAAFSLNWWCWFQLMLTPKVIPENVSTSQLIMAPLWGEGATVCVDDAAAVGRVIGSGVN